MTYSSEKLDTPHFEKMSMKRIILTFLCMFSMVNGALAAKPTEAELAEARHFVAVKLEGQPLATENVPRIDVIANHGPVSLDSRGNRPLKMGDRTYRKGFFVHANSRLEISLDDKPVSKFEAIIGVDSNEQTSGGRGSVRFAVEVGGEKKFQSETIREGMPVQTVSVDLQGHKSFALLVDDAGDGIACDQANWAEAKVVYMDGTEWYLSDMAIDHGNRQPISTEPIFSFDYGGINSKEFLDKWNLKRDKKVLDANRTQYTLTYTDPQTALEAKIVAVAYNDFPTVEWTLYFTNHGKNDTPILSNIRAIDTAFNRYGVAWTLNHHRGDVCAANSYEPFKTKLQPGTPLNIATVGGKPTKGALPYFNLSFGNNQGLIFVVSWAGQWSSTFGQTPIPGGEAGFGSQLTLQAGQEQTHFLLHPGETVRQPMIVLQFWRGDYAHAQNVWRRWMIAHNIPRPGGKLPKLPMHTALVGETLERWDTASQIQFIDKYLERGFLLDYWWMDAGWYIINSSWQDTGTWEVDQKRFPGGLLPITEHGRAKGVKSIVWFEPERLHPNTWLADERPNWVHGGKNGGLLKLSEPDVLDWVINHFDKLITDNKVDLYRQDFNIEPLGYWRENDTENRQGITEIRHIENYFKYWDALRERHPNMLIDSCASGGQRNDLETLRRSVPLLRSDYQFDPVGEQAHSYALSLWVPYYGTGFLSTDPYYMRSVHSPSTATGWDVRRDDLPYEQLLKYYMQWKEGYGKYYFGDYYTLTPYSLDNSAWIGWQYHDAETEKGTVQMFRRGESLFYAGQFPLFGLSKSKTYKVTNIDNASDTIEATGEELMSEGLRITIPKKASTGFYLYEGK